MIMVNLDAHQKPPEDLRKLFKRYQKLPAADLAQDECLIDIRDSTVHAERHGFSVISSIDTSKLRFPDAPDVAYTNGPAGSSTAVLASPLLPGLHLIPGLLSADTQIELLSKLLHRDLANPQHLTNLHKHYRIPYEVAQCQDVGAKDHEASEITRPVSPSAAARTFFRCPPDSAALLEPLDPQTHKPLTVRQFLTKKLRWVTLGGQYDWTDKKYPQGTPPEFPKDVAALVHQAFPNVVPQAAIVNVYSTGDTLSLHRDVSEASSEGLVSISLGCEAIFLAGLETEGESQSRYAVMKLRSGDAVYMSGASRYAWHGVPRILADSCPSWMRAWPAAPASPSTADPQGTNDASPEAFVAWRNWMAAKRINLNVRQMFDERGVNPA